MYIALALMDVHITSNINLLIISHKIININSFN